MSVSPLIAAEGYFFCLDTKEPKNQVSKKASLAQGLALQIGQNHGLLYFALLRSLMPVLQQNSLMPFLAHMPIIVLSYFAGSCFADKE
jgi:hypothetical protein